MMIDCTPIAINPKTNAASVATNKQIFVVETISNKTFITEYAQVAGKVSGGQVLSTNEFIEVVSQLRKLPTDTTAKSKALIDSRILLDDGFSLVWTYTPEPDQNLYYSHGGHGFIGVIQWPTFIFRRSGNQLSIGVIQSRHKRPTLDTKVYRAPLPNISGTGAICLGSAKLPKSNLDIDAIAKAYLDSTKTHFGYSNCFRHKKEITAAQYVKWLKQKESEPVRVSELAVFGTVKDFIKK